MSVWMRHPDLPPEQVVEVDDRLVAGHRASGWVVTDAPPKPEPAPGPEPEAGSEGAPAPGETPEASATAVAENSEPAPDKQPSRRRTPKEGDNK